MHARKIPASSLTRTEDTASVESRWNAYTDDLDSRSATIDGPYIGALGFHDPHVGLHDLSPSSRGAAQIVSVAS